MGLEELFAVKEEMEKAEARKFQPYFVRAFFTEAFKNLGGEMKNRESGRYEISHVPASIRERDSVIGETRTPVLKKYERICFEKQHMHLHGKPMADLIHPGHPIMHACIDLVLEAHRNQLKQGAILLDPNDDGIDPKTLFMIDHSVREGNVNRQTVASRRLQFVEIGEKGKAVNAGWAPHLDLQHMDDDDISHVRDVLNASWINENLEQYALTHASKKLAPEHYREVKGRRENQVTKIEQAVQERLVKEIDYWSDRYIKLKEDVEAGKQPKMQPNNAKRRAEELTARLEQRKKELESMRNVVSSTPVVIGGALIIPKGLLAERKGETVFAVDTEARARVEQIAMQAVIHIERSFGYEVIDVSEDKCGWDVTARPPALNGKLQEDRHIEVKGRAKGQTSITVSRNEIIYGLNQSDKFILGIVIVDGEKHEGPYYVKEPFTQEPDFGVASINYELKSLLSRAVKA